MRQSADGSGQLEHGQIVCPKAFTKVTDHFLYQRSHRRNAADIELVHVDRSVIVDVLVDHGEQDHVRLIGIVWGAKQQIFITLEGRLVQANLDSVERFEAGEHGLHVLRTWAASR